MATVTVSRVVDADAACVHDAMSDLEAFMLAAGFDEASVEGEEIRLRNRVGVADIGLTVALVDDPEAALAYEQSEGMFERMDTRYYVADHDDGTELTATTEFELPVPIVGAVLDSTVIKRQRRHELDAQFDYVESVCGE